MQKRWLNDRQPDENGDYILVIENSSGARVSTFKGKSIEEVADALADSQVHANREISRLRKPDTARPTLKIEPKSLTAADRLRLSSEMTDPERVVEAVEEIVTARQGIAPDRLGAELSRMGKEERDAFYAAEAQAFREEHPEFYPVPQNRDALFDELKANGWDLTRNNLAIAFQTLWDRDEMIPWPDDSGNNPQPPVPIDDGGGKSGAPALVTPPELPNGRTTPQPAASPRPRSVSTGIRNADASASAPAPVKRAQKYTRADIEKMSRAEWEDKLRNEPGFRQQVNAMSA
jgi:hypothetical protein